MRRSLVLLAAALSLPGGAAAQTLRDDIREMFTFGSCGEPLCLNVTGHGDHFIPEAVQGQDNMIRFLGNAIGISVAGVPVSSASGGSTFTFESGAPVRTSVSSGPILGERAQTIGRGRFLAGVNASAFRFRSLRGTPTAGMEFNFRHANVGSEEYGNPVFETDVIQVHSDLEVDLQVVSVFVTAGLMDRVDVSVAVPLVSTSLRGTSTARVLPFGGDSVHRFDGQRESRASTRGSARGIGDVAVRAKVNVRRTERTGMALLADVRLPTEDDENLLGAGAASVRGLWIVSARYGGFSPHVNAGYLYRAGDDQNSAVLVTAGFDQLVSPSVTLAVDLVSEWQMGTGPVRLPAPLQLPGQTMDATNIPDRRDDVVSAALGVKVLLRPGVGLVANALVPVVRGGLQPDAAVSLGLESNF